MPSRPISGTQNPNTRSRVILLGITISATVIFLLTIIYIVYYLWDSLFGSSRTNPLFDSISHTLKLQKLSYKDLKSATNGFDPQNSIGKGGSGTVFRGILRDGKSVAIKKLDAGSSLQADREFQTELTILASIKSPHIVSLLGYCIEKNKRLLVYEYMPNHSLQERLFNHNNNVNINGGGGLAYCMDWERRFQVVQDVAKALEFLHNECEPPVIHGDVKPSNVLLDWEFKAKLSDFGLSRVKADEGEVGVEMFSQDLGRSQELWKSQELSGNLNHVDGGQSSGGEVDFALALQASSSSKNGRGLQGSSTLNNPKGKEVMVEDHSTDLTDQQIIAGVDHSKEVELNLCVSADDGGCVKQWGKDWWWKQDDSGELSSKEYVNEWIGTQVDATSNRDWENNASSPLDLNMDKLKEGKQQQHEHGYLDDDKGGFGNKGKKERRPQKSKARKMQDWWKEEEEVDEMNKKSSKRKTLGSRIRKTTKMPHFSLGRRLHHIIKMRRSRGDEKHPFDDGLNRSTVGLFKKDTRRKHARSLGSEMSGDLLSRELSSTTSMRGTLCYVAPEYGGCGYLIEKGDIYSLGVLILVIVSGRRPLHVLNSPMKLEKANLISWCRHLAQGGNVLELVDERLKDAYDREQVTLCIHLALACLQRMPELRPDIGDIVRILRDEMELPPLPFEFSPSPPSKFNIIGSRTKIMGE